MERMRRFLGSERAADLLLWAVITAPVLLPGDRPELVGLPLTWVRITAVPLLACAVLVSRRTPVAAAAVPPALGLAATPELYTANFTVAQVLLAYLLGRRSGRARAALLLSAAVFAAGLLLVLMTPGSTPEDAVNLATQVLLTLVLPWLAGRYMRQRAELERTGWELAERLELEQEMAGERVRLRERSRIAQDMHDSLGHDLSLIALRAAALQVAPDIGPKGRQAAGELRQDLAAATERLREVIGVLREDGQSPPSLPAAETVASLVQRAAAAGVAVRLDDGLLAAPDGAHSLPPMTDRAAYRVVQEALTNAAKHAPGAAVTVTLRRDGKEAVINVVNEALERPPAEALGRADGSGLGLVGLDERVRRAGGTLRARPAGGGFAVTARLPLTPGAATPPTGEGAPRHELVQARRRLRRSMIDAIWVPTAAAAVLLLLTLAYNRYIPDRTVLDEGTYQQLRIGERQPTVENQLPSHEIADGEWTEHAPGDPHGADECRFYRTTPRTLASAYRLCFTHGQLSSKDELNLDD
jgi:signal transduction histidine kinase